MPDSSGNKSQRHFKEGRKYQLILGRERRERVRIRENHGYFGFSWELRYQANYDAQILAETMVDRAKLAFKVKLHDDFLQMVLRKERHPKRLQ